ncbi:division plane positioning ATPase MipZ [Paenarthrobacter sp. CAP02]|uniref:AAA family ATPase n=1 Tax=Paenarthrobacter sp. CAP02 TaxID=3158144 RepID=UPI0032D9B85B
MILTIGSLKGGCSKSTLTVNLAAELARQGKKVTVVDADRIASTTNWIADREERSPDLPSIIGVQKKGNLRATLLDLDEAADFVIVDTGGYDSQELRTAATASDVLVVPMKASPLDLDTLPAFVKVIEGILDFNAELAVRGLFTQASTHAMDKRLDESRDILSDYPEIPLFQTTIYQRSSYMDVMPVGRGVVEWTDSKAKAEIQVLAQELINIV